MQLPSKRNIRAFLSLAKSSGYSVATRPYELNIFGVRANKTQPNTFDDQLYAFYKDDKGAWKGRVYQITTDPGTYWLKNPMQVSGTAILKSGQYKNTYKIGLHQGKYEALVQSGPVTIIRDYDRNAIADYNNGKESTGTFGINIHRALSSGTTKNVDKWSAGCQVFANADDYNEFLQMAKKHSGLYGNTFTYTLVDERAYSRKLKRYGLYIGATILVGVAIFTIYKTLKKKK